MPMKWNLQEFLVINLGIWKIQFMIAKYLFPNILFFHKLMLLKEISLIGLFDFDVSLGWSSNKRGSTFMFSVHIHVIRTLPLLFYLMAPCVPLPLGYDDSFLTLVNMFF